MDKQTAIKHVPATPLPWGCDDFANFKRSFECDPKRSRIEYATVYGNGGDEVARFCHEPGSGGVDAFDGFSERNANYIVHAANSYPQLVEALQATVHAYDATGGPSGLLEQAAAECARTLLRSLGESA